MLLCVYFNSSEIADEADKFQTSLLTADAGCQYDSLIEINLDTVWVQLITVRNGLDEIYLSAYKSWTH